MTPLPPAPPIKRPLPVAPVKLSELTKSKLLLAGIAAAHEGGRQ